VGVNLRELPANWPVLYQYRAPFFDNQAFGSNGQEGRTYTPMTPQCQTLFSLTLFLALSSLLAWSNRHQRGAHKVTAAEPLVRGEDSVKG